MAFERRSLELTPAQWAAIEEIAERTGSIAPSGPTAGRASWRTLMKRIAEREVEIVLYSETARQREAEPV
jgi:hypothetical protein